MKKTSSAKKQKNSQAIKTGATSKQDRVIQSLKQPKGISISDLVALTGWQPHSVRGFISGTLKKKLGLPVLTERGPAGSIYRIAA